MSSPPRRAPGARVTSRPFICEGLTDDSISWRNAFTASAFAVSCCASASRDVASASARVARTACQVLTTMPATSTTMNAAAVAPDTRCLPHELLQAIRRARRRGEHRLAGQVALDVHRQPVRGLVAARAVLLERLHDDPVELAAQDADRASAARRGATRATSLGVAASCDTRVLGFGRLDLADDPLDLRVAAGSQRPRDRTACAGEQLVEQHAQRVHVRPRVDVQPAFGLLRAHVLRRADQLAGLGEERLVGQAVPPVALAMPKSITLANGCPSCVPTSTLSA